MRCALDFESLLSEPNINGYVLKAFVLNDPSPQSSTVKNKPKAFVSEGQTEPF